jgi:hypothetical protein
MAMKHYADINPNPLKSGLSQMVFGDSNAIEMALLD